MLWGTDAAIHTAEGWASVAKRGDRFACLEPNSGVRDRFGQVGPDVARGIRICH